MALKNTKLLMIAMMTLVIIDNMFLHAIETVIIERGKSESDK